MSWRILEVMEGARKVVSLNVNSGEKVLIIGSTDLNPIGYQAVGAACAEVGCEVVMAYMTPRSRFGEEPPEVISAAMKKADVVFQCGSTSLFHSKAGTEATLLGVRQVSMYFPLGQEVGVLQRAAKVDSKVVKNEVSKCREAILSAIKKGGRNVRITSALGTDFTCELRSDLGDYIHAQTGVSVGPDKQDVPEAGAWPPATLHPFVEETSGNGVFVADSSISGVGPLKQTLTLYFKDGLLTKFEGGEEAKKLESILEISDPNARCFCEIGMAINPMGKITGFIAEDKRGGGTLHIAIGKNDSSLFLLPGSPEPFGRIKSNVHMDAVAAKASLEIGGIHIINEGQKCW